MKKLTLLIALVVLYVIVPLLYVSANTESVHSEDRMSVITSNNIFNEVTYKNYEDETTLTMKYESEQERLDLIQFFMEMDLDRQNQM